MGNSMEVMLLRISCPMAVFVLHAYVMYVRQKYPTDEFFLFTLILPSVIFITVSTMITKRNVLLTRYILPVAVGILNIIMCFSSENIHGDYEVFFISMNWLHLMKHLLQEIGILLKLLMWYLVSYFRRFNPTRVILFIAICAIHSVLIILFLDKIVVKGNDVKEMFVNHVFRNSVVESEISTAEFHYRPLSPLYFDDIVTQKVTVHKLQWDNVYDYVPGNVNFRYKVHTEIIQYSTAIDYYKLCHMEIISSIGGDASIHCELTGLNQGMYFIHQKSKLYWSHNEEPVVINDRLNVETNFTFEPGENNITSNLSIFDLQKEHFGEYKLWLETGIAHDCLLFFGHKQCKYLTIEVTKTLLGRFILTEIRPRVETLFVPVGGLLFIPHLTFHSFSDISSISVLHKINNSLYSITDGGTNTICNDKPFNGCSILMFAYFYIAWPFKFQFFSLNDIRINIFVNTIYQERITSYIFYSLTCICEKAYGEHTFVIQRDFYNKSSKKMEILETELPWKFLVLPTNWMFQTTRKNYSTVYDDITGEYNDNSPESRWQKLLKSLLTGEDALFENRLAIEICFIAICFAALFVILHTVTKTYTKYVIVPLRCCILGGQLKSNEQNHADDDTIGNILWGGKEIYDAMIINTERDSLWAETVLLPLLEQGGHKVYYPRRDDTPGVSALSLASVAVSQSRNFIVICSEEFRRDAFENRTVFSQFVLTKIEDYHNNSLLMVKVSPCEIPKPLIWRNDCVDLIDWTTKLSEEEKIRYIRKWIRRCKTVRLSCE